MNFRLVPKSVIFNAVMLIILHYYTDCITFES